MNKQKHINKALHNEEFWSHILETNPAYLDWAVTGLFYSAMHYIDAAYFALYSKHLKSHEMADEEIGGQFAAIYSDYRTLKDERWKASYYSKRFVKSDVEERIIPCFDKVKDFAIKVLDVS